MLLPFNVHHLGQSAYGLWMLTASMTTYFSVLDLGFGGAIVKFVAQYRARRDVNGLNDIASTLFVIFSVMGVIAYGIFLLLALNINHVFSLSPEQMSIGRRLMLIIGVYVSLGLPFSIFGGIINGFQRYDLNNVVGVGSIRPDDPCVTERRLNASCWTMKRSVSVTIANVIARVRNAIHATGSEANATAAPTTGST